MINIFVVVCGVIILYGLLLIVADELSDRQNKKSNKKWEDFCDERNTNTEATEGENENHNP